MLLTFKNVSAYSQEHNHRGLWRVNINLQAGELLLILQETGIDSIFVDTALGFVKPDEGSVLFDGIDWSSMNMRTRAHARSKTARFFADGGWVRDISIYKNILLGLKKYHNPRDIETRLATLSRYFGLPGIPYGNINDFHDQDQRRSQLIKTFLFEKELYFLELPEKNLFPGIMGSLVNMINECRNNGSSIVWITENKDIFHDLGIHASQKARISGTQIRSSV